MSGVYFFTRFNGFDHDSHAPISQEFQRLAKQQGWRKNSKKWRVHWNQCIADEYAYLIGHRTSNLLVWQALCAKLDLMGDFSSINKCRKALSRIYVNLVDLLECWDTPDTPRKFRNVHQLAAYTKRESKTFDRKVIKQDKVLKVLLKEIS